MINYPYEQQKTQLVEDIPYEFFSLQILPECVANLSAKNSDLSAALVRIKENGCVKKFPEQDFPRLLERLREMFSRQKSVEFGNDVLFRNAITELLLFLCTENETAQCRNRYKNSTVQSIVDYVDAHLTDPELSLRSLAAKYFLSPSRVSHLFKENVGDSLHRYILKRRLAYSQELLRINMPMADICSVCGFGSYRAFFRAFTNVYGITPKTFARQAGSMTISGHDDK